MTGKDHAEYSEIAGEAVSGSMVAEPRKGPFAKGGRQVEN